MASRKGGGTKWEATVDVSTHAGILRKERRQLNQTISPCANFGKTLYELSRALVRTHTHSTARNSDSLSHLVVTWVYAE